MVDEKIVVHPTCDLALKPLLHIVGRTKLHHKFASRPRHGAPRTAITP